LHKEAELTLEGLVKTNCSTPSHQRGKGKYWSFLMQVGDTIAYVRRPWHLSEAGAKALNAFLRKLNSQDKP